MKTAKEWHDYDNAGTYKPGDMPPEGYLQWHAWADVQRKAGIKQEKCGECGLWRSPQELAGKKIVHLQWVIMDGKLFERPTEYSICKQCKKGKHVKG